ncbi:MAG: hypothetical protein AABZ34_04845 [Nitrospirota bacterium]
MAVMLERVAEFLFAYAARYREVYARATAALPGGAEMKKWCQE